MKIHEAAAQVLRDAGQPLHAPEIYERIVEQRLYDFRTKDPVAVLKRTLRKKAEGTSQPLFREVSINRFGLVSLGK